MRKLVVLLGLNIVNIAIHASELSFRAEKSVSSINQDVTELQNNVVVLYQDRKLTCDYAKIYQKKKTIFAQGNIHFVRGNEEIFGKSAVIDFERNSLFVEEGVLKSGSLYFEAKYLFRTAEGIYIADGAKYTTCQNCPETWSFLSSKIRAEVGKYAYMKNLILRIGGIPVFWMPYLIVPLKSERQTGLLTPQIETSGIGGATFAQSFFWAINQSSDLTLTVKNYELRGLKTLFNYRFQLSDSSGGEMEYANLTDRTLRNDLRFKNFGAADHLNRSFFKYNHFLYLPDDYIHRADFHYTSDLQYPTDFPLEAQVQGAPAQENRTSLTKNTQTHHFSMEMAYYINLVDSHPKASNEFSVHRLPEIRLSQKAKQIGNTKWLQQFDLKYTQFVRN
ncbi:MAG: LPS assembly protein LptD, partial [Pseudobdellovibrionaceae bacterium]|nr:LPS assembly protein LptD [Pseudobdellovibrionaceae bacterium]